MADERDECFIPADKDDFKTLMNGIALTEHINKLKEFGSGSEVTDKQFTLLRTYFPRRKAKEICEQDLAELFGANKNYLDEADALLDKSPAFQNFLNKVGKEVHTDRCKEGDPEWSSQFTTALRWLKKILTKPKQTDPPSTQEQQHAPARASRRHKINYAENDSDEDFLFEMSKKPKKKDSSVEPEPMAQNEAIHPPVPEESVVNSFCVDFLMELGALIPACRSTWDIEHVNLKAKFNNGNYVARTDGCLKTETNGLIQAIVEVKPRIRSAILASVQKQEASEVSAWFHHDHQELPDLQGRRILLSQNRHEMFITIANPEEDYSGYIRQNGPLTPNAFLPMQTYGPWDLTVKEDVRHVAKLILALTLAAHAAAH